MITKIYKVLCAGVVAVSLAACSDDFLEVQNPTGEPLEEYYMTDEHLSEACTSAYAPLHWPDWDGTAYNDLTCDAEILGDDFWVGGASISDNQHWHKLFNFEGDGNNTLGTLWGDFYSGIKRCNDVIKYCSWGGGNEKNRKSYEMQARLLRVYYYNILWHYYGNVPFYLENLTEPYTAPQISADEIYGKLLPELEEIIASNVLPMRWEGSDEGRVSQAMAYMLFAEMVMYQNDSARYPAALGFMKQIISDSKYSLNPSFKDLFDESGEMCAESIFEITYDDPTVGLVAMAGTLVTMVGDSYPCVWRLTICMPITTCVAMSPAGMCAATPIPSVIRTRTSGTESIVHRVPIIRTVLPPRT